MLFKKKHTKSGQIIKVKITEFVPPPIRYAVIDYIEKNYPQFSGMCKYDVGYQIDEDKYISTNPKIVEFKYDMDTEMLSIIIK
jgi:hypothetical protein